MINSARIPPQPGLPLKLSSFPDKLPDGSDGDLESLSRGALQTMAKKLNIVVDMENADIIECIRSFQRVDTADAVGMLA